MTAYPEYQQDLGQCCVCGKNATETRGETKVLEAGGKVHASNTIVRTFCLSHALDYDATKIAERVAEAGIQAPKAPPSTLADAVSAPESDESTSPSVTTPLVSGIALQDDTSAALAVTWEQIMGVCYMAAQIPTDDVRDLLSEYDRTDDIMPTLDPTGYKAIMGNIPAHREIARTFLALRETMDTLTETSR